MDLLKFYLKTWMAVALAVTTVLLAERSFAYSTPSHTFKSGSNELSVHTLVRYQSSEPVVLIGGGPGFTAWNLEPIQFSLFTKGYTSSLMDVAGMGENRSIQHTHWMQGWTEDFLSLIRSQSKPVTLIGHSWGSLMALHLTRTAPELIKKVILINPVDPELKSLDGIFDVIDARWQTHSEKKDVWDNAQLEPASDDEAKLNIIRRTVPAYFHDFKRGQRYAKMFKAKDIDPAINSQAWDEYRDNPIQKNDLANFSGSLHMIACQQDPLMPASSQGLNEYFPNIQSTLLDSCGHFPWVENPKAFEQSLLLHLKH